MMPSLEFDLLRFRPFHRLVLWRGFPYAFQVVMLTVFVLLACLGFGVLPPDTIDGKLFAKSNIVTLVIWGLWWPAMIWTAVLFGRFWCMLCPLELVANLTERLSRRLGIQQRVVGKWLRSGALMVIFYAAIQMFVAGVDLHRSPASTSVFLLSLLGGAVAVSFVFKDRAFCSAFCPVAPLLNTYGRGGMLAIRSGSGAVCQGCRGKDCLTPHNRERADGRSCPSLLNPPRLNSNKDCLICGQCIKACGPDNMRLLIRTPFSTRDRRESLASWPLTLFVMMASGFVASELAAESKSSHAVFMWLPERVVELVGAAGWSGWFKGVWTLGIFPAALWLILGATVSLLKGGRIPEIWRTIALPAAVIVSSGHMSKAIAKFTSWVGYAPFAFEDPSGLKTALGISSHALSTPLPLLDIHVSSYISIGLLVTGTFLAFREVHLANLSTPRTYAMPQLALTGLFILIVAMWGR